MSEAKGSNVLKKVLSFCLAILLAFCLLSCKSKNMERETANDIVPTASGEIVGESYAQDTEKFGSEIELPYEPDDNEFWYDAAEEFLSDYLSLFTGTDSFLTYEYYEENGLTYRRTVYCDPVSGMIIDQAPYIIDGLIAFSYSLHDLNNDGILEIMISYGKPESDYIIHIMYKFADGKYHEFYQTYLYPEFFTDKQGKTVLRMCSEVYGRYGVYYVTVNDEGMELDVIVDDNLFNHLTQEQLDFEKFYKDDTIIPDMPDEPLIKSNSFDSLRQIMTGSITNKLKADNKI